MALVHGPGDRALAGLQFDARDLAQGNECAATGCKNQVADRVTAVANRLGEADRDIVAPFADENPAYGTAANSGLDQVGDVGDIDAISRGSLPIDLDDNLRQRGLLVEFDISCARDISENIDDLV